MNRAYGTFPTGVTRFSLDEKTCSLNCITVTYENTVAISNPKGSVAWAVLAKPRPPSNMPTVTAPNTMPSSGCMLIPQQRSPPASSNFEACCNPERNEKDQEVIVQAVLRWLRLHPDWLLIYDNMDDLSIAEPFLPKAGAGHLLFTTRACAFGDLAQRLDIEKMDPDIGALLLLRRASLLAVQATLSKANPDEEHGTYYL